MNTLNKLKSVALMSALAFPLLVGCQRDGGPKKQPNSKTKLDHLIIKEIFYVGHLYSRDTRATYGNFGAVTPVMYDDDQYIVIYNPTEEVKYLDGLALATNALDPSQLRTFSGKDNYVNKYYGASGLSYFPGSGTEYPIQPKGSVVVAKYAIDHKETFIADGIKSATPGPDEDPDDVEPFDVKEYKNLESLLDLSKADFEWTCSKYLSESAQVRNNPKVPDLTPMLEFTNKYGRPESDFGFGGLSGALNLALVKLPWTPEDFNKNHKDTKDHRGYVHYISINSSNFADYYAVEIPNDHVIDCVTICPKSQFQMRTTKMDRGHNAIADKQSSSFSRTEQKRYTGLALTRKFDGRKFVDDDNSSSDFEVKAASLSRKDEKGNIIK